ncbi:MAG: phage holin family protein [Sphingomicrobium sp.]
MLKPTDPPPPGSERPIGEIVRDIVDDGKAYARAELNVAKTMVTAKLGALKAPVILLAAAMFVGMAALNALAVAIFVALATVMSPLLAGILAFLLIGAVAALLGWLGIRKLGDLG